MASNTVTCSKKAIHCKFNRTEKSKLPIQCPRPSFSTSLSQVRHFFFPNCLLKKDEIHYQRKTFIPDLRIISVLMSIIDMLTQFTMGFLRFLAILWIFFLFLCFSCKKKKQHIYMFKIHKFITQHNYQRLAYLKKFLWRKMDIVENIFLIFKCDNYGN